MPRGDLDAVALSPSSSLLHCSLSIGSLPPPVHRHSTFWHPAILTSSAFSLTLSSLAVSGHKKAVALAPWSLQTVLLQGDEISCLLLSLHCHRCSTILCMWFLVPLVPFLFPSSPRLSLVHPSAVISACHGIDYRLGHRCLHRYRRGAPPLPQLTAMVRNIV